MIINKQDKSFQVRSDMPNTNWLGEDYYLVEDDTELANKIIALYPRFEFVTGKEGNLIDVTEIAKTEMEAKEERKSDIKNELTELDNQINRPTEDLYTLTQTTPYKATQDVINRKQELRQELQKLNEGSEVIGTDNPNNEGEIVSTDK